MFSIANSNSFGDNKFAGNRGEREKIFKLGAKHIH
jgi:hypothetical protein